MSEFTKKHKKLSDYELLEIILYSENYHNKAVDAAKKEIKNRYLSESEIAQLKQEIILKRAKDKELETEWIKRGNTISNPIIAFFNSINPTQYNINKTEKIIRILVILIGIYALYTTYNSIIITKAFLESPVNKWGSETLLIVPSLLFITLLLTAIYHFYKKRRIGWFLMLIFLSYITTERLAWIVINIYRDLSDSISKIPYIPSFTYFMFLFFFIGSLYTICRKDIRAIYHVTKKNMYLSIGATIILYILYLFKIISFF